MPALTTAPSDADPYPAAHNERTDVRLYAAIWLAARDKSDRTAAIDAHAKLDAALGLYVAALDQVAGGEWRRGLRLEVMPGQQARVVTLMDEVFGGRDDPNLI